MKTENNSPTSFRLALATLVVAAGLLGGCLKERLVWSPDGRRAAVITEDGLYVSDEDGRLSPRLATGVYRVAWLGGSQQLALARSRKVADYPALAAALGPERTRALTAKAEAAWQKLQTGQPVKEVGEELGEDGGAVLLYLRERHREPLRKLLGSEWKELESAPAELHTIAIARLAGEKLEPGATLHESLASIQALRPAPGGTAIAFTTKLELSATIDQGLHLFVVAADGSAPPASVASQVAAEPDWTPDGHSLVYLKAPGPAGREDHLRLGVLAQREVLTGDGRIRPSEQIRELAGLAFQQGNRVRCLRNGRVLFSAPDLSLPIAGDNRDVREHLFALEATPEPTISRLTPAEPGALPKSLSYFFVSPDDNQVLIGSDGGEVWLLTLATGAIDVIAPKIDGNKNYTAPAWRRSGEFTLLREAVASARSTARPVELFLHRGRSETKFSQAWPDELLRRLIE